MIVPYKAEHLKLLTLQSSQLSLAPLLTQPSYAESLAKAGPAYSLVDGDAVIACGGLFPQWEGRSVAWALIGAEAGRHFVSIHKAARRLFAQYPCRRIEACVTAGFEQGYRWVEMLGFKREGLMHSYTPEGADCYLYARVQP